MAALRAHFDGRVLIPDEPLNLPIGQRVLIQVEPVTSVTPKGVPGRSLLRFAGTMSDDEAAELKNAVEEECEKVDEDGW